MLAPTAAPVAAERDSLTHSLALVVTYAPTPVRRHRPPGAVRSCPCRLTQLARTSSVHTLKLVSVLGPNVLLIATSEASRPRATNTLPMRGVLLRASKVCQCPSRKASNHAAKSIVPCGGGTRM